MRATCRRSLSQLLGTGSASLHPDYFIPKDKRLWSGTRGNTPPIGDRGREQARWNADREFLELAAPKVIEHEPAPEALGVPLVAISVQDDAE